MTTEIIKKARTCRWCTHDAVCCIRKNFVESCDATPLSVDMKLYDGADAFLEELGALLGKHCDWFDGGPGFEDAVVGLPNPSACLHTNYRENYDAQQLECRDCGAIRTSVSSVWVRRTS